MHYRTVRSDDAPALSAVLKTLTAAGKRTSPDTEDFVRSRYIGQPANIRCTVACDENGTIMGFQILSWALAGNPYGVAEGWGIIGTHIDPAAARRGVGRTLFSHSLKAAEAAGISKIDASIGADNDEGLAYYEAMGFRTYRTTDTAICKAYTLGEADRTAKT